MRFQLFHNKYFKSIDGSYSLVTPREVFDSQITLTDTESSMVIGYFGLKNIQIGNVASDRIKSKKIFHLFPNFVPIELNLVFPKPDKHELRLYISSRAGFKPQAGEVWFLFIDKQGRLTIGSMSANNWSNLDQIDTEDESFLEEVEENVEKANKIITPPKPQIIKIKTGATFTYKRNSLISSFALKKAGFRCEIDKTHKTFISQKTNFSYSEAHHFIPMKFQDVFKSPLDCVENIISLCPNCHRGFHHAVADYKRELITKIYDSRKAIDNLDVDNIFSLYNSIPISE